MPGQSFAPLDRLQGGHARVMLLSAPSPPLFFGMTWSRWGFCVFSPQPADPNRDQLRRRRRRRCLPRPGRGRVGERRGARRTVGTPDAPMTQVVIATMSARSGTMSSATSPTAYEHRIVSSEHTTCTAPARRASPAASRSPRTPRGTQRNRARDPAATNVVGGTVHRQAWMTASGEPDGTAEVTQSTSSYCRGVPARRREQTAAVAGCTTRCRSQRHDDLRRPP